MLPLAFVTTMWHNRDAGIAALLIRLPGLLEPALTLVRAGPCDRRPSDPGRLSSVRQSKLPNHGVVMITLTIMFLLIFVPACRGVLRGFVSGIFSLLGLALLVTRNSGGRRRGL
jgi:hypothetical protein